MCDLHMPPNTCASTIEVQCYNTYSFIHTGNVLGGTELSIIHSIPHAGLLQSIYTS